MEEYWGNKPTGGLNGVMVKTEVGGQWSESNGARDRLDDLDLIRPLDTFEQFQLFESIACHDLLMFKRPYANRYSRAFRYTSRSNCGFSLFLLPFSGNNNLIISGFRGSRFTENRSAIIAAQKDLTRPAPLFSGLDADSGGIIPVRKREDKCY